MGKNPSFSSFSEFYPIYLSQHSNLMCRRFHFIGTCIVLSLTVLFFFTGHLLILWLIPVSGYGLTWPAHLMFEKNKPMAFKYPLYTLIGDFKMFWDILTGKLSAF